MEVSYENHRPKGRSSDWEGNALASGAKRSDLSYSLPAWSVSPRVANPSPEPEPIKEPSPEPVAGFKVKSHNAGQDRAEEETCNVSAAPKPPARPSIP